MKKNYYMPVDDSGKELWLKNFSSKLSLYATRYSITAAEVTDMVNSALNFTFYLNFKKQYEEFLKKSTAFKNEMRDGSATNGQNSPPPTPPVLPTPPTPVASGIFVRATGLVNRIKNSMNYTVADGLDLGIESSAANFADLDAVKPALSLKLIDGGRPEIIWKKGNMDALEIHVDRGDGSGFNFLEVDMRPNYTDTAPLPEAAQLWSYKAIYRRNDHVVGQWSDITSITVVKK